MPRRSTKAITVVLISTPANSAPSASSIDPGDNSFPRLSGVGASANSRNSARIKITTKAARWVAVRQRLGPAEREAVIDPALARLRVRRVPAQRVPLGRAGILEDHLGGLLGDHDRRRVGVAG